MPPLSSSLGGGGGGGGGVFACYIGFWPGLVVGGVFFI
jgi:hypothetical protein